jgi:hypothetical protein
MVNIRATFTPISRGFERSRERRQTAQTELNFTEVFDCISKIRKQFTVMFPGSPRDDFSQAA